VEAVAAPLLGAFILAVVTGVLINPKRMVRYQGIAMFAVGELFTLVGFCAKLAAGGDNALLAVTYMMWIPCLTVFGGLVLPYLIALRVTCCLILAMAVATAVWLVFNLGTDAATPVVLQSLMTGFLSLVALVIAVREVGARTDNAARELATTQAAADQANQAKTEFLARMSHDLRTPLNAVIGFADAIKSEVLGGYESWPRYRAYAGDIVQSGEFLLAMVNDLLDIARIEAGGLELTHGPVDLAALVGESVSGLRQTAARGGVTLISQTQGVDATITADRRALQQILQNLLSNAVKFTPAGNSAGVQLFTSGDTVTLEVWDNGIGIAAAELPHLGEPFRRIGHADLADRPGTGLGLAIVKNLVALHGGTLSFESAVGSGTTARVTLPIAQAMLADSPSGEAAD
jgi:signal transduction histidine kinase